MRVILDSPTPIEKLRKTYNDKVTFVTTTQDYPLITEIEMSGNYLGGMRKRLVPVRVGKKVDKLIARYAKRLNRIWNQYQKEIVNTLSLEGLKKLSPENEVEKADAPTLAQVLSETDETRRQVLHIKYLKARQEKLIKPKLEQMKQELQRTAKPMFESAYLLGKERGQILTQQEMDDDLNDEDEELLEEKAEDNDVFVAALVAGTYDDYEAALGEKYDTEDDLMTGLRDAHKSQQHRLDSFAATLGAALLAAGMSQAVRDIQEVDADGEPTGEVKTDPETGEPLGDVFEGGYWHTREDERVCDGCEQNDGAWMTLEDFQEEANTNDCLSNCRCIELFEPAPMPTDQGEVWSGTPGIDKGVRTFDLIKHTPGGVEHDQQDHAGARAAREEIAVAEAPIVSTPTVGQPGKVPAPRKIGHITVRYDEVDYREDYADRHKMIEEQVEEGLQRIPDEHKGLVEEIIIDDDILNATLPNGSPVFSAKEALEMSATTMAFVMPNVPKIIFNANTEAKTFTDKGKFANWRVGTIIHEVGHKVFEAKVLNRTRAFMNEGRKEEAEAFRARWEGLINKVSPFYDGRKILRGNELESKANERGAGLYRAYLQHGEKFQSAFPEVYTAVKDEWFEGKEYRRGKLKKLEDPAEPPEIYHYTRPDGVVIYTTTAPDVVLKHLPGQHDQLTHAGGGMGGRPEAETVGKPTIAADYESLLRNAVSKLSTEEQRKIQDIREKLKTTQTTKQQYYDEKTGQYTPERQALHEKIAGAMLAEGTTQEQPTVILTGGLPGSGKSSITSQKDIRDFVKIDSDAIKAQFPEYDGWNAALLQNEADDVISRVMVQAVKDRKNILFDGTMKAEPKYGTLVDRFSAFNYKVGIWFAELPMENAMDRVISRWRETGRFVDPTYVATHNGHNKNTMDRIKDEVDFYEVYDSNVPFGEPAKLKERGHATAEAKR